MHFIKIIIFLAFILFTALPADAKGFDIQSFTLKNGMQIVVIPNHRSPVISHMIWYKFGGSDEPIGKSGVAHFLEHLFVLCTTRKLAYEGAKPDTRRKLQRSQTQISVGCIFTIVLRSFKRRIQRPRVLRSIKGLCCL